MSETQEPEEEELAPYKIEAARSSRSRCRTCNRKINKGLTRLGVLLEGPYGTGYLWHHLTCAAKRRFEDVEQAYELKAWGDEQEVELPPLEELRKLREEAEEKKAKRQTPPYAEKAPTGRSKCKHCEELIPKDAFRVVLARTVEFYGQVRAAEIKVHAGCVAAELRGEDCCIDSEGFEEAVRAGSKNLTSEEVDRALAEIGAVE